LENAQRPNAPLATVYDPKEALRQVWEQPDRRAAERFLADWSARALVSGIRVLQKFAPTPAGYCSGIPNWSK
jgi:hypothetical protein